jgi:catechol 2,3-dioxygenase-like lactoylglutathione lyase family enzyme
MTTTNQITGVASVGIPVTDQDKALEFYTTVLGLSKSREFPMGGGARWLEVAPSDGGTTIALTQAEPDTSGVETGIRLRVGDADAFRSHLMQHGASADDVLRWPGVPPMFTFRDQDGNGLVAIQSSPTSG